MDTELLEKYIQFAIDNWFRFWSESWFITFIENNVITVHFPIELEDCEYNLIETITSEKFIKAISIWFVKQWDIVTNIYWEKSFELNWFTYQFEEEQFKWFIDKITIEQAIAIRDSKLEEFIKTIL